MTLTLTPVGGNRMILSNIQLDPDTTMTQAQVERLAALYNLTQAEVYDRAQTHGFGPLMRRAYLRDPVVGYGDYPAEEYADVATDMADAEAAWRGWDQDLEAPAAVTYSYLEEPLDLDAELELAMEEALANCNAALVDMGNDPVASGRNLGLRQLAEMVPTTAGSPTPWPWIFLGLVCIAFWYLYYYVF